MARRHDARPFPTSKVVMAVTWALILGILWMDHHQEEQAFQTALHAANARVAQEEAALARRESSIIHATARR